MARIKFTRKMLMSGTSANGGYSLKQLRLIGVYWPPESGWMRKVIGKKFDESVVNLFISLKDKHFK